MSEVSDSFLKNKIGLAITLSKKLRAISALSLSTSWTNTNTKSSFWGLFKEGRTGYAQNIEQYYRYSLSYNCTDKLEKIKSPILLIYGQKDQVFYRYAKLLHDKLPQSELKWIKQVNHNYRRRLPLK